MGHDHVLQSVSRGSSDKEQDIKIYDTVLMEPSMVIFFLVMLKK